MNNLFSFSRSRISIDRLGLIAAARPLLDCVQSSVKHSDVGCDGYLLMNVSRPIVSRKFIKI